MTLQHPHLVALAAALDAERAWQEAEHARLLKLPNAEQVAAGISWSPLAIDDITPTSRGRAILRLRAPRGTTLHDGIGSGDAVTVGPVSTPGTGHSGICLGAEGRTAEVRIDGPFADAQPLSVTLQLDSGSLRWFRSSLEKIDSLSSPLRDVLLGEAATTPVPEDTPASRHFAGLNASQRRAARAAIGAPELALVHGPPGTGKTLLLTAVLRALVNSGERPWALADSNAAVDHLALQAHLAGLNVVRIGHPGRISDPIQQLHVDMRIESGPLGPVLKALDRDLIRLWSERGREAAIQRRELRAERDRITRQARDAVLLDAEVIACTLGSMVRRAARVQESVGPTRTAVVDEATQAIEPAILSVVPWVERLVLAGDPYQLGPVVMQPGNALERSLLQRLTTDGTALEFPMLEVQHRMNALIQGTVSHVYGPALRSHPDVVDQLLADLPGVQPGPLTHAPVLWVDTAGAGLDERRDPITLSLYNDGEARLVALAVRTLLSAGVSADHIGVIAPYSAAVDRIRGQDGLEGVEVSTVNAFQGREKEAIVCCWVRSNPDGDLGFVADPRRLTVALTRARRFLLCIGDSATLANSPRFAQLLDTLQETGAWRTVWEEPWSEAMA